MLTEYRKASLSINLAKNALSSGECRLQVERTREVIEVEGTGEVMAVLSLSRPFIREVDVCEFNDIYWQRFCLV
jgi:hypothetical protein